MFFRGSFDDWAWVLSILAEEQRKKGIEDLVTIVGNNSVNGTVVLKQMEQKLVRVQDGVHLLQSYIDACKGDVIFYGHDTFSDSCI